jgi:uncharacterized membrane protein HdeD (DUF308 family)
MREIFGTPEAVLAQKWWVLLLWGVFALIFGILALAWPLITLEVLIILFGAFALVTGIFALISAAGHMDQGRRVLLILQGVAGIVLGIIAFAWPGITAIVLVFLIAAWALIIGILEIIGAFGLPAGSSGKGLMVLSGALAVVFGVLLLVINLVNPLLGLLTVVFIIGIYAIIRGITLFALAFLARKTQQLA